MKVSWSEFSSLAKSFIRDTVDVWASKVDEESEFCTSGVKGHVSSAYLYLVFKHTKFFEYSHDFINVVSWSSFNRSHFILIVFNNDWFVGYLNTSWRAFLFVALLEP